MSVLIKNMEMPQKCGQCKLYHAEHPMHCMAVEGHRTVGAPYGMPRPDWCPLVELPVPHGRLIDADALKTAFPTSENATNIKVSAVRRAINRMSTIIEAERKATE
jgi:hypothetical protein